MDKKNEVSIWLVILMCLNAVIWSIHVFLDLAREYTDTSTLVVHILCAIAWDTVAIAWILHYLKSKKNHNQA